MLAAYRAVIEELASERDDGPGGCTTKKSVEGTCLQLAELLPTSFELNEGTHEQLSMSKDFASTCLQT